MASVGVPLRALEGHGEREVARALDVRLDHLSEAQRLLVRNMYARPDERKL